MAYACRDHLDQVWERMWNEHRAASPRIFVDCCRRHEEHVPLER